MAVDNITFGRHSLYTLSTLDDGRNSTITGSTLNGPSGSAQFSWVYTSTTKDFQVRIGTTVFAQSTLVQVVGILQNKPGPGEACDIGYLGVSKVIAGSTSITNGTLLQQASTFPNLSQSVVPWQIGSGPPIGYAMETPTSTGAIFSAMINTAGQRST